MQNEPAKEEFRIWTFNPQTEKIIVMTTGSYKAFRIISARLGKMQATRKTYVRYEHEGTWTLLDDNPGLYESIDNLVKKYPIEPSEVNVEALVKYEEELTYGD